MNWRVGGRRLCCCGSTAAKKSKALLLWGSCNHILQIKSKTKCVLPVPQFISRWYFFRNNVVDYVTTQRGRGFVWYSTKPRLHLLSGQGAHVMVSLKEISMALYFEGYFLWLSKPFPSLSVRVSIFVSSLSAPFSRCLWWIRWLLQDWHYPLNRSVP